MKHAETSRSFCYYFCYFSCYFCCHALETFCDIVTGSFLRTCNTPPPPLNSGSFFCSCILLFILPVIVLNSTERKMHSTFVSFQRNLRRWRWLPFRMLRSSAISKQLFFFTKVKITSTVFFVQKRNGMPLILWAVLLRCIQYLYHFRERESMQ